MSDENINLPLDDQPIPQQMTPEEVTETAPEAIPETIPENLPEVAPEVFPEASPEMAPTELEPELIPTSPQPEEPFVSQPEIPTAPQPEMPAVNTPQPPYTPPTGSYSTPPYTPPYTAPYQAPYNPASTQYVPAHGAPQPKKRSIGARVMLICLWVLLGIFSLATVGSLSYYAGLNNQSDSSAIDNPIADLLRPTEPTEAEEEVTEAVDYSHLYGDSEIVLNPYPADKGDTSKYNNQTAFEKVSPSAVGIMCYQNESRDALVGQGTGIVINTDGYIATNSHVIGDSKSAYIIDVILSDGNTYEAQVVGFDTRTDLAVVKITAKNLVPAEFADSDLASIGEDVIAVGNPGGIEFQNTLTRGVISAKDRTLGLSTQVKYIQTDAAINPGNSGGPLANLCGQVIGINSAKIASEEYEGMGFAIPSRTVKEVVDDLISQGYVSDRVKIGIIGTAVTASEAHYNNVPQGILVSEVIEGGPCDNGEVQPNDIVVALDDYEIKSFNDIYTALMNYREGDKATLKLYRMDTDEYIETEIVLQADTATP